MMRISKRSLLLIVLGTVFWLHLYTIGLIRTDPGLDTVSQISEKAIEAKGDLTEDSGKNAGASSMGEFGRLGTPGFVNLPDPNGLAANEIQDIAQEMKIENERQHIHNLNKFGPVDNATYVIVIQVHSRLEYLSLLIQSLSKADNIDKALLVFSHDLYLPALNEAIQNIDFARVMQIFYPFSIQLHPHSFPGESPDDCPRNLSKEQAMAKKCRNADSPDIFGHYREAKYTQTKHHWWWKANFVFDKIPVLRYYQGVVTFIEEDHYVTPDFLWVLSLMETEMIRNRCRGCDIVALGTYIKYWNIRTANAQGVVTNWISSKHNMGMAFNRTLWTRIKKCTPTFCNFDDYNWDFSLMYVSQTCLSRPMTVYYAKAPRIFHIGDCGMHAKHKSCNPTLAVKKIDHSIAASRKLLFPDKLTFEIRSTKTPKVAKGNGGWGDTRDKQLCASFSANQTS